MRHRYKECWINLWRSHSGSRNPLRNRNHSPYTRIPSLEQARSRLNLPEQTLFTLSSPAFPSQRRRNNQRSQRTSRSRMSQSTAKRAKTSTWRISWNTTLTTSNKITLPKTIMNSNNNNNNLNIPPMKRRHHPLRIYDKTGRKKREEISGRGKKTQMVERRGFCMVE